MIIHRCLTSESRITPSINVDDMLKNVKINYEIEKEKLAGNKQITEIRPYCPK